MAISEQTQVNFRQEMEAYRQIKEVLTHYELPAFSLRKDGRTWVVQTDERLVRVERFNHSLAEFFFVISAVQYLKEREFMSFPQWILNRDGRPVTQYGNGLFYIIEDPEGLQPNVSEIDVLTGVTRHMAEMHRASVGFTAPQPLQDIRQDWGDWEEKWQFRLDELYRLGEEAQHRRGEFDKAYLKVLDDFLSDGVEALETLKRLNFREMIEGERLRGGLCHRDYKPENLVEKKNSFMLLDFDDFAGQSHLEDIARFIREVGEWDPDRIQYIFEVYHQVYAITPEEREAVLAYLKLPLDLWRVARNFYFRDKPQKRSLRKVAQDMIRRKRCYSRLYEPYRQVTPVNDVPWIWGQSEIQQGISFDDLWTQLNYGGNLREEVGHVPAREPEDISVALNPEVKKELAGWVNAWVPIATDLNDSLSETIAETAYEADGVEEMLQKEATAVLNDNVNEEIEEVKEEIYTATPIEEDISQVKNDVATNDPAGGERKQKAPQAAEKPNVLESNLVDESSASDTNTSEEPRVLVWKAFPKV